MNGDVMDLSDQQFESIVEEVTRRLRPVVQSTARSAPETPEGAQTGMPPMVVLPPEFYQSQREISDRVARLEERFVQFDQRFEKTQSSMDQRFEKTQSSMDKRFEEMQSSMDKRFEEMQRLMDKRFEAMDKWFDAVDKRFESVDKHFEAVDRRFEALDRRFNGVVALISLCTVIVGGLVVLFQVL